MDTRKFAMTYGAVLGAVLSVIALIIWNLGIDENQVIVPVLNSVLIIAFLSYAIIQYRNEHNGGFISYSESLKLGTTVAFFSSVILAFYQFVFISYINPSALSEVMSVAEQAILEANPEISDEELEMRLEMMTKFSQPHWMMIMGVLGGTFMGFLYSLIISIFVKNEDPNLID